jgi:K+-transporting ATPase KdpF subunit
MTAEYTVGTVIAVVLVCYLIYSLLRPERF